MNDEHAQEEAMPATSDGRVGFRDIYRAVGESESRIKEHITLVLLPITTAVADHEVRIRAIEEKGSHLAREVERKAAEIAIGHETLKTQVATHEDRFQAQDSFTLERRRLMGFSNKALATAIVVANFIVGLVVLVTHNGGTP